MTKPVPDEAEIAMEYPDELYIETFQHTAWFDAHFDKTGIALGLHRAGSTDVRKSVYIHFHYALFAEILRDLAKTAFSLPNIDIAHRANLRDAAKSLYLALKPEGACDDATDLTADEEVRLLHIME